MIKSKTNSDPNTLRRALKWARYYSSPFWILVTLAVIYLPKLNCRNFISWCEQQSILPRRYKAIKSIYKVVLRFWICTSKSTLCEVVSVSCKGKSFVKLIAGHKKQTNIHTYSVKWLLNNLTHERNHFSNHNLLLRNFHHIICAYFYL